MEPPGNALGSRGRFTQRQLEVLDGLSARLTNAEIAARLGLSERTVESHVSALMHKVGVHNRRQLAESIRPSAVERSARLTVPHQLALAEARAPCAGRSAELNRLLGCWDRVSEGTRVAVVRGEAGIGKSRISAAVAMEIHRRGGRVLLGLCSDGPQRPYEPFVVAMEHELSALSGVELRRRLGASAQILGHLFPALLERVASSRAEVLDAGIERGAVYAALHHQLECIASSLPTLLVVEDLHWGSIGSREVIAHIARFAGSSPLMVLVTIRDERPHVDDVSPFLAQLARLPSVDIVELSGVDVEAAAELISSLGSALDAAEGVRVTRGNPLYLRELALGGPEGSSLRDLAADRFRRLCDSDLAVLDLAAVAGEQIDASFVAAVLDRDADAVLRALGRAEAAGLIVPGDRPGRFVFSHAVFRAVRYATILSAERMRLHASIADGLALADGRGGGLADRARHSFLAGPCFDATTAAEIARQAGDVAAKATDHGEAAAHYRRALDALERVPHPDEGIRLALSISLGEALVLLGDANGQRLLADAADQARRSRDDIALARAVCGMSWQPGSTFKAGRPDPRYIALAEAAMELLPADQIGWQIRVQALLAVHLLTTGTPERATEMIEECVQEARHLGDPVILGRALLSYRYFGGPSDMKSRISCGDELIELGQRTGLEVFACIGRQQLCWCHRELGNRSEMDRWFDEADRHVRGQDLEQWSHTAAVALMDGDVERAARLTDQIGLVWQPTGAAAVYIVGMRMAVADTRCEMSGLAELERRHTADPIPGSNRAAALARGWARNGRTTEAMSLLVEARVAGFPQRYAARSGILPITWWAEVAAIVHDCEAAALLQPMLDEVAGQLVDAGPAVWDTVDRVRAWLRLECGDAGGAEVIASNAVRKSRVRRTPIFLARELVVLAEARRRLGGVTGAREIAEAQEIARSTGAHIVVRDLELITTKRPSLSDPPVTSRLTRREHEIVTHMATGSTNSEVARALGIAPATVRKHLEHAYGKMQVSTRTAAAARLRDATQPPAQD